MLQRFASTAFVAGTLLTTLLPAVGLARDHSGNSGGGRSSSFGRSARGSGSRSFSRDSRNYAPRDGNRYSGGQSFVSRPGGSEGRREYSSGPSYYGRGYAAPRSYGRPVYGGYYSGGFYPGYGAAYGYTYDPGYAYAPNYAYDPGYSSGYSYGPPPAPQTCAPGSYDRYNTWVPNPDCYSNQQQYPPPQQNYGSNQQQYPPLQRNYNPNQQQLSQPQPNYDPNQPQPYNR